MVEHEDYEFQGHGPGATGPGAGWRMRPDFFAECPRCGELLSLDPSETATCSCGSLHKDTDAGRFGSTMGDDRIAIYRLA
jgi:hypothetical protein